jgi:hypothetical protein
VIRLEEKVRMGSRVKRVYDDPLSPYAGVLASAASARMASTDLERAPSTDPQQGICPESPIGVQWPGSSLFLSAWLPNRLDSERS